MEVLQHKTKILIVGQWFVSEDKGRLVIPGGTERYVYGLANQLQNDGYEVMVLSATTDSDEIGFIVIDGIKTFKFKAPEKLYGYSIDFLSFINTLRFIIKFNPDVLHIISSRFRFAVGAVAASKILHKKNVFTLTLGLSNEKERIIPYLLDEYISSKILRKADTIISLSKEMKEEMIRDFSAKKIIIIPSFFMDVHYDIKKKKQTNSILFVGRLEIKQKGIDLLIKSLVYLKENIPNFKLHIIGKGSSLNYLIKLVSDYGLGNNVIFHGHVEENELIEIFSMCEIFVLPSLHEGMPMVLLESMSAGLPVVAFDIDPVVEALDNGRYGILVKKGDIKMLAEAMMRLLKDDKLRKYFSAKSLERSKIYSQAEVARQIEKVYSVLIKD